MRYSRMQGEPYKNDETKSGKGMIAVIIVIIIAVGVYLIGAAKVGAFFSDNVLAPVAAFFSKEDGEPQVAKEENEGSSVQEGSLQSANFVFDAVSFYALQTGVYSEEENAKKAANELREKGGAGYLLEEDGSYRVLLSGYASKEDAENVKERLKSEQNMDTKIYEIKGKQLEIRIESDEDTIHTLTKAKENFSDYPSKLAALSISFDKGELGKEACISEISALREEVETKQTALNELATKSNNRLVSAMEEYYRSLEENLLALENMQEAISLSCNIKHSYLECMVSYLDFIAKAEGKN